MTAKTIAFLSMVVVLPAVTMADEPPRQFYSKWEEGSTYHSCKYYCQPQVTVNCQYEVHHVYWWPNDPVRNKWMYCYNPVTQTYWGRCPCPTHPDYRPYKEQWCKRDGNSWTDIVPGYCPVIPGSGNDGPLVETPPIPPPAT